jgi:hypothetical protein
MHCDTISTMPNGKRKNSKDNHSRAQALEATQMQKKPVTSNARTNKQNAPTDENIDPRRSTRLNTAPKPNLDDTVQQSSNTVNASQAKRILATTERPDAKQKNQHKLAVSVTRSTARDEDAQLQGAGLLEEIQELQRQLQEEKGESSS